MCLACSRSCCAADHLAECGCSDCIEPNCWTGWEASQERDFGDESTVSALLTLAVESIDDKEV